MRIRDEYLHGSDQTGVVKKIEVTIGTGNNANQSVIKYTKADSAGGVVEVPIGDITGKAATASKLDNTSAIGSKINPVYFTEKGVPSACTYSLNATVPVGAANQVLYYSATNTLDVQSYTTLTSNLDVFTAATSSTAGKKGLVPAPSANQLGTGNFFLRADGVWTVIENKTAAQNGTATSLVTTGEKYNWNSAYNWYNSMTSGDTDGIINKWKEVEAFLANYGDSSTLAAELAKLVTLSTDQTITGVKTFSQAINADITGNADTVDNLHASDFARSKGVNLLLTDINSLGYGYARNGWYENGPAFTFGLGTDYARIQKYYDNNSLYLGGYSSKSGELGWREFAFTDSNVASANYATSAGSAEHATSADTARDATLHNGYTIVQTNGLTSTIRNFTLGTLVRTSIDYSVTNGDSFYVEIKGNTYTDATNSCFTQIQGYIYVDTILSYGVTHLGVLKITPITAMNIDGKLCFWFPRLGYWMGFDIRCYTGTNYAINTVTSIEDSSDPGGTKRVTLTANEITSYHSGNLTSSVIGNLGILSNNISGNAATASSVDWSGVTNKPTSFTPSIHTHTTSEITDFPTSLPASDVYDWAKAATKPSYSWAEITSKPTTLSGYGITDAVNIAGGVMTGTLASNGGHYIGNPEGGNYYTRTGSVTGCITITLPAGVPNTMISMWVDVYNYEYLQSFSVHLGGYTYNEENTWINSPFAMVYGAQHKVRLGYDGTHFVIYIGETTSVWSYPQISVRDVTLGYSSDVSAWRNAWSIGFSTTLQNVTAFITTYAYTTKNLTTSVIDNLGTLSNDISGNAATATSVDWSGVTNRPTNVSAFYNDAKYLTSHAYSYGSIDIYDANGAKKTSNNTVSASVNTETLRLQEGANIAITATNSGTSGSDVIKIAVTGIESNINQNGYGQLALWYNGAAEVSTTLQSSTFNELLTVKAGSGIDFSGVNGTANNDVWTISAIPYNCAITLNNNSAKSLIKDSWSADKDSVYLTSNGTSGGTSLAAGTYALWIEDRSTDSGTPNYYSGTFTCAGSATAGRLDEIALHSSMATIADTNAPTRIFVATQISSDSSNTPGKHVLRFCSQDSKATPHYLTVKVNRII